MPTDDNSTRISELDDRLSQLETSRNSEAQSSLDKHIKMKRKVKKRFEKACREKDSHKNLFKGKTEEQLRSVRENHDAMCLTVAQKIQSLKSKHAQETSLAGDSYAKSVRALGNAHRGALKTRTQSQRSQVALYAQKLADMEFSSTTEDQDYDQQISDKEYLHQRALSAEDERHNREQQLQVDKYHNTAITRAAFHIDLLQPARFQLKNLEASVFNQAVENRHSLEVVELEHQEMCGLLVSQRASQLGGARARLSIEEGARARAHSNLIMPMERDLSQRIIDKIGKA